MCIIFLFFVLGYMYKKERKEGGRFFFLATASLSYRD